MAQKIFIIGGLEVDYDRAVLLSRLHASTGSQYSWDWLKATGDDGWRIAPKHLNSFRWTIQQKLPDGEPAPKVVMLRRLGGDVKSAVFRLNAEPALAPDEIATGEQLYEWLVSPDAGIIPPRTWAAGTYATALVCILVKLVRNKSFNKDRHGHAWTQEADLLGQSPVNIPGRGAVRTVAGSILEQLDGSLFISKGANQGKTKKEWCINTALLPSVKRVLLDHSFEAFKAESALTAIVSKINGDDKNLYDLQNIVSERVLSICREKARS